jgi:hypothetical protein
MRLLGAPAIPAPGLHPFLNQALRRVVDDIGGSHWRQFFNCFQRDFGTEWMLQGDRRARLNASLDQRMAKRGHHDSRLFFVAPYGMGRYSIKSIT